MNREIRENLIWAAIMLPLALAAKIAQGRGYISADTTLRIVALNGLWIAYYGNLMPKKVVPAACARDVRRVAGWSLVLGGLAYASLWLFAPIPTAATIGTAAVAASVIVTLGYCLWLKAQGRPGA